jgi:hypothetical protein
MMFFRIREDDVFGLVRPALDAHTLGPVYLAQLLAEAGYSTVTAGDSIARAMNRIQTSDNRTIFMKWLATNRVTLLGVSFRLDPQDARELFGRTYHQLEAIGAVGIGGAVRHVFFAGLPEACEAIKREFGDAVTVFKGDETPRETLSILGVPKEKIPPAASAESVADEIRWTIAEQIVAENQHQSVTPPARNTYPEFGTAQDTVIKRIAASANRDQGPVMRAHVGPYSPNQDESLREFEHWLRRLATTGFLDVVSIGTSQLTQESFGERWGLRPNGGGVPINSPAEYERFWHAARPMLMRTYAGTNDVPRLARMHEESLNIAWHALSFWWFSEIDGRGPNTVAENLRQHFETLDFVALTGKPIEPNIPHHFAFRGGDDLTYILSALLAAKAAKARGVRIFILQVMLNTPKQMSSSQDIARARALVELVREQETRDFRIILQPRAGLDYLSPDVAKAKKQLAAVSMMMADIEPASRSGPEIVHVVSYSEANSLATPEVVDESIQLTRKALERYGAERQQFAGDVAEEEVGVQHRTERLKAEARALLDAIEQHIQNPYSSQGFYAILQAGFLVAPSMWQGRDEFKNAVSWTTKIVNGGVAVVDADGTPMSLEERTSICIQNLKSAQDL